jgi:hypothetical protein
MVCSLRAYVQRSYVSLPLTAPRRTFTDVEARDSEERSEPSLPQGNFSYQEREGKSWRCMTCFPLSTRLPNPMLRSAELLCSSRQIIPSSRAESSSLIAYIHVQSEEPQILPLPPQIHPSRPAPAMSRRPARNGSSATLGMRRQGSQSPIPLCAPTAGLCRIWHQRLARLVGRVCC